MNKCASSAAASAMFAACKNGYSEEASLKIAENAAELAAKSFLQNAKNMSGKKGAIPKANRQRVAGQRNSAPQNLGQASSISKNSMTYKNGTMNDSSKSLASSPPSHLKNKVLVISRIRKDISVDELKQKINEISGKTINYLHEPVILSKAFQQSKTIALELNNEDYSVLSDVNIWHSDMRIAEFKGHKFWHKNQPRMTPLERRNAVRDSWIN